MKILWFDLLTKCFYKKILGEHFVRWATKSNWLPKCL